jgi:hypothetical protein
MRKLQSSVIETSIHTHYSKYPKCDPSLTPETAITASPPRHFMSRLCQHNIQHTFHVNNYDSFISGSTALCWALASSSVSSQGRLPTHRTVYTQNKRTHSINAHTDIHASSGIRTHDPSVRPSEDSSCLRPRGYCGRKIIMTGKVKLTLGMWF